MVVPLERKFIQLETKDIFYGCGSQEVFIVYTAEDRIAEGDSDHLGVLRFRYWIFSVHCDS